VESVDGKKVEKGKGFENVEIEKNDFLNPKKAD
jgi:hypothetical protein